MKILLVEDDPVLRAGLSDLFAGAGHEMDAVGDGGAAVARGLGGSYDLVVLDLTLPALDGIDVCRRLRAERPSLLILALTARHREDDKVLGLRAGADDYVTKPFGARELLARIEALGRRARREERRGTNGAPIEADGCVIDVARCVAARGARQIPLTAREARLLELLWTSKERILSRAELLQTVWGASGNLQTRTVDMTVANLRQKIERDPAAPRIVTTVKGVGYSWGRP